MSDHFSGPRAIAGPQCDICDLYAFVSPEHDGNLVLVMDVVPRATTASSFSEAIICRFRLRTVTVGGTGTAAAFTLDAREIVFDCTFDAARTSGGTLTQSGRCLTPGGDAIPFSLNDEAGGAGAGVRVFAGLRSEPFFLDFDAMMATLKTGKLSFTSPGTLVAAGANVLSLVVEIDAGTLRTLGLGPLVSVVGETVAAGPLGIRLERVGRPEIKNFLLSPKNHDTLNRDLELRDLYNLEDAYHIGPDYRNAYRARLDGNLAYLDALDGDVTWPLDDRGRHPLTELILADFLVVDLSKPFAEDSFLEIEQAMLAGRPHRSSGGRSVNDDIMDTLYTLTINGGRGPRVSDGVDQALSPATRVFPYLVAPNPYREIARPGTPVRPAVVHDGHQHEHHAFGQYEL